MFIFHTSYQSIQRINFSNWHYTHLNSRLIDFIKEHLCYNEIAYNVRGRDKMDLLTEGEIQKALTELPKWERVDEKWLKREFYFNKYLSGIAFVQEVAEYAQEKRHHPMIIIDHTTVTLKISSIEKDGLTDLDVEMVREFNKLYEEAEK